MTVRDRYVDLTVEQLSAWAQARKADGWQFVQLLAAQTESGADLVYTLRKDDQLEGGTIRGVTSETHVPSITDWYLAAFVFENEVHDLFGIQVDGIAIDFGGNFYRIAVDKPMTIVSPEVQKRRDKANRAKAAAAAKAQRNPEPAENAEGELEAILAQLEPDTAERLRAALKAAGVQDVDGDQKEGE